MQQTAFPDLESHIPAQHRGTKFIEQRKRIGTGPGAETLIYIKRSLRKDLKLTLPFALRQLRSCATASRGIAEGAYESHPSPDGLRTLVGGQRGGIRSGVVKRQSRLFSCL
jgi:hypothetical protein